MPSGRYKDISLTEKNLLCAELYDYCMHRGLSLRDAAALFLAKYKPAFDKAAIRQIFDESLADWKFVLPLEITSTVLCLGSHSIGKLVSLSQSCGRVYACSESTVFAMLQRVINGEGKHGNIFSVCGCFYQHLPFSDNFADFVDIDWSGLFKSRNLNKKERIAYIDNLFHEIFRVLKPAGKVYFSSCSSFMAMLRGKAEHSFLGSIKFWTKKLQTSGFLKMEKYLLYPDHYYFNVLFPLSCAEGKPADFKVFPATFFGRRGMLKKSVLNTVCRIAELNYFLPGFAIVAAKE